jgi:hypothetical protein
MTRGSKVGLGAALIVLLALGVALGVWVGGRNGSSTGFTPGGASHERLSSKNPFGLFLSPLEFDASSRARIAHDLGAHYYRSYPVLLPEWDGECLDDCEPVTQNGLVYFLTIRNTSNIRIAATPVQDLEAFKDEVARIIQVFKPAIIAVENEEDAGFFDGPADQYLAELQAACQVAHSKGIPCTNGGITSSGSTYLEYQHLVQEGKQDEARDYAQRAFNQGQLQRMTQPGFSEGVGGVVQRLDQFVLHYKEAGADYINFHFYGQDPDALRDTARHMEEITGLPALSNEFGANTEDGQVVRQLMQAAQDLGLDAVVWYSNDVRTARSLVNQDGSPRDSGQAFMEYVHQHFGT